MFLHIRRDINPEPHIYLHNNEWTVRTESLDRKQAFTVQDPVLKLNSYEDREGKQIGLIFSNDL